MEYYINGDETFIYAILNGISMLWNDRQSSIWSTIAGASLLGLLAGAGNKLFDDKGEPVKMWLLGLFLLGMLMPPNFAPWARPQTVTIENLRTGDIAVVDNVPLLPAFLGWVTSSSVMGLYQDFRNGFSSTTLDVDIDHMKALEAFNKSELNKFFNIACERIGSPANKCSIPGSVANYVKQCFETTVTNTDNHNLPTNGELQNVHISNLWSSLRVDQSLYSTTLILNGEETVSCPQAWARINDVVYGPEVDAYISSYLSDRFISSDDLSTALQRISPSQMISRVQMMAGKHLIKSINTGLSMTEFTETDAALAEASAKRQYQMASNHTLWMEMSIWLVSFMEGFILFTAPIWAVMLAVPTLAMKILPKMFQAFLFIGVWQLIRVVTDLYSSIQIAKIEQALPDVTFGAYAEIEATIGDAIAQAGNLTTMIPALATFLIFGGIHAFQGLSRSGAPNTNIDATKLAPDVMASSKDGKYVYGTQTAGLTLDNQGDWTGTAISNRPYDQSAQQLPTSLSSSAIVQQRAGLQQAISERDDYGAKLANSWNSYEKGTTAFEQSASVGSAVEATKSVTLGAAAATHAKFANTDNEDVSRIMALGLSGNLGLSINPGKFMPGMSLSLEDKKAISDKTGVQLTDENIRQYKDEFGANLREAERWNSTEGKKQGYDYGANDSTMVENHVGYQRSQQQVDNLSREVAQSVGTSVNANLKPENVANAIQGKRFEDLSSLLTSNGFSAETLGQVTEMHGQNLKQAQDTYPNQPGQAHDMALANTLLGLTRMTMRDASSSEGGQMPVDKLDEVWNGMNGGQNGHLASKVGSFLQENTDVLKSANFDRPAMSPVTDNVTPAVEHVRTQAEARIANAASETVNEPDVSRVHSADNRNRGFVESKDKEHAQNLSEMISERTQFDALSALGWSDENNVYTNMFGDNSKANGLEQFGAEALADTGENRMTSFMNTITNPGQATPLEYMQAVGMYAAARGGDDFQTDINFDPKMTTHTDDRYSENASRVLGSLDPNSATDAQRHLMTMASLVQSGALDTERALLLHQASSGNSDATALETASGYAGMYEQAYENLFDEKPVQGSPGWNVANLNNEASNDSAALMNLAAVATGTRALSPAEFNSISEGSLNGKGDIRELLSNPGDALSLGASAMLQHITQSDSAGKFSQVQQENGVYTISGGSGGQGGNGLLEGSFAGAVLGLASYVAGSDSDMDAKGQLEARLASYQDKSSTESEQLNHVDMKSINDMLRVAETLNGNGYEAEGQQALDYVESLIDQYGLGGDPRLYDYRG